MDVCKQSRTGNIGRYTKLCIEYRYRVSILTSGESGCVPVCKAVFLLIFLIIQSELNAHMIPRQKDAITSVGKCTLSTILLIPTVMAKQKSKAQYKYL